MQQNYSEFQSHDVERHVDTSSTTHMPKSWANIEDPVVPLERNSYGHPLAGLLWERQFEEVSMELGWEKLPNLKCVLIHRKQGLFSSENVDYNNVAGKSQNMAPMWNKLMKNVSLVAKYFSTTYIWDALNVNASRTNSILMKTEKCSTHEFLLEQLKKHQVGNALRDVCELADIETEQLCKVSKSLLGWSPFQEKWTWFSWKIVKLSGNACIWLKVELTFFGPWTNLLDQSRKLDVRNKRQYLTVLQNQKLCCSMLVSEWTGYLLLTCGTWW